MKKVFNEWLKTITKFEIFKTLVILLATSGSTMFAILGIIPNDLSFAFMIFTALLIALLIAACFEGYLEEQRPGHFLVALLFCTLLGFYLFIGSTDLQLQYRYVGIFTGIYFFRRLFYDTFCYILEKSYVSALKNSDLDH